MVEALQEYLQDKRIERRSPRTIRDYQDELAAFIRTLASVGHSLLLGDVGKEHIKLYLAQLEEQGLAPTTINRAYGNLRAFFRWMVAQEYLERSPTDKVKAPKVPQVSKPLLPPGALEAQLYLCPDNTFNGARRRSMLLVLHSAGIRLGELAGLELPDLDWQRGELVVFGKGAKERVAPFTREAQLAVRRYLRHRGDTSAALWVTVQGRPMAYGGIQKDLERIFARAGMRELGLRDPAHIHRRSWAVEALEAGIGLKDVQLTGGWATVQAMEPYLRTMNSRQAIRAFHERDEAFPRKGRSRR